MLGVTLDGHHVDRLRLVRMDVYREAEISRQVPADLFPGLARIVAAHDVPVLLHVQHLRTRWVHGQAVNAVADLCVRVRDSLRTKTLVRGTPALASIIAAEHPGSRYGDEDALGVARIDDDRVQAHAASSGLPRGPRVMAAESRKLAPVLAPVGGAEKRSVLNAG